MVSYKIFSNVTGIAMKRVVRIESENIHIQKLADIYFNLMFSTKLILSTSFMFKKELCSEERKHSHVRMYNYPDFINKKFILLQKKIHQYFNQGS